MSTELSHTFDSLDGLGNWRNTTFTPQETDTQQTEVRQHNGLNQITRRQNGGTQTNLSYDGVVGKSNGNLANDGTFIYLWDALNRLAQVNLASDDSLVAAYAYDALNRRVRKTVGSVKTDCIYSGWRCVEDRNPDADGGDAPTIQYVWGRYLDELLQIKTYVEITTGADDTTTTYAAGVYYPLQDLLYRTVATTDSSGNIVEAYDFDAYGNTLIFNAVGSSSTWWDPDAQQAGNSLCQFLFTGQRFDAETGLYYYKRRYYSAVLGRFLSSDQIQRGARMYLFVDGNPLHATDPYGLQTFKQLLPKGTFERQFTRKQFEETLERQFGTLSKEGRIQLDRGCVGVCSILQACDPKNGPYEDFPENAPDTKCYLTESDAAGIDRMVECLEKDKIGFVFAIGGQWRTGKKPTPKGDGTVPNDSIVGAGSDIFPDDYLADEYSPDEFMETSVFNYITEVDGVYVGANWGVGYGPGPQAFKITRTPNTVIAMIWCTTCKCKKA